MLRLVCLAVSLWSAAWAVKVDYGQPSFLTSFIESNRIEEALKLSSVPSLKGSHVVSHAGLLTVDKVYNSTLFMWFFESETSPENARVVLYLQGSSAMKAIFEENGRYYLKSSKGVGLRKHYWSRNMNVLYMDSLVGAGFSFTDNNSGYPRSAGEAAALLHKALAQFFVLFAKYRKNEFYIVGQGFGSKLAVFLAESIDSNRNGIKINLKGLAIGNHLFDPKSMVSSHSDFLYNIGLIDIEWANQFKVKQKSIEDLINQKQFSKAANAYFEMMGSEKSMFTNTTGYRSDFNVFNGYHHTFGNLHYTLEKKPFLRNATHVGHVRFEDGVSAMAVLKKSVMESVKTNIEILIKKYRILFYSGQMNIVVPYVAVSKFLSTLEWNGKWNFQLAIRRFWTVDGEIAGYCKQAKTLMDLMIVGAGQSVSLDQPKLVENMILKFTTSKFSECS